MSRPSEAGDYGCPRNHISSVSGKMVSYACRREGAQSVESGQPPSMELGCVCSRSDALRADRGSLLSLVSCHCWWARATLPRRVSAEFSVLLVAGLGYRSPAPPRGGDDLRGLHPPATSCCLHPPYPPVLLKPAPAPPGLWHAQPEGSLEDGLLGMFGNSSATVCISVQGPPQLMTTNPMA